MKRSQGWHTSGQHVCVCVAPASVDMTCACVECRDSGPKCCIYISRKKLKLQVQVIIVKELERLGSAQSAQSLNSIGEPSSHAVTLTHVLQGGGLVWTSCFSAASAHAGGMHSEHIPSGQ